jgi:hypothetical protein
MGGYLKRLREAKASLREAEQELEAWTGSGFPEDLNDKVEQRINERHDARLNRAESERGDR